jgi:HD-GYP domain-containing protein (c-di-GMP phosphodiesterase class II)
MREFVNRYRTFVVLSCVQACCLAAGLWASQRFQAAHAQWEATQQANSAALGAPLPDAGQNWSAERAALHVFGYLWLLVPQIIVSWLLFSRMQGTHERHRQQSREDALRASRELLMTRDAVVFGLAKLAESRDSDTGLHLERIALYSTRLAAAMRRQPRYRDVVDADFVSNIGVSSALHDIGKVGVEDSILLKPGRLTHDEHFRIQSHVQLGAECIRQIQRRLAGSEFLDMAREIALYHHERWDGRGYPVGLSGAEIPLAARVVAVADVYDALRTRRVYKEALPHDECVRIIREDAGTHFDPDLVDVFLSIQQQFREISERFQDQSRGDLSNRARPAPARMSSQEAQLLADVTEFTGVTLSVVRDDAVQAQSA